MIRSRQLSIDHIWVSGWLSLSHAFHPLRAKGPLFLVPNKGSKEISVFEFSSTVYDVAGICTPAKSVGTWNAFSLTVLWGPSQS